MNSNVYNTPERQRSVISTVNNENILVKTEISPSSPRLRKKISALLNDNNKNIVNIIAKNNDSNTLFNSPIHRSYQHPPSSPLSPAVEKSHITFDILNDLENQKNFYESGNLQRNTFSKRKVHFTNDDCNDLSMASQEYLKKYGLI